MNQTIKYFISSDSVDGAVIDIQKIVDNNKDIPVDKILCKTTVEGLSVQQMVIVYAKIIENNTKDIVYRFFDTDKKSENIANAR